MSAPARWLILGAGGQLGRELMRVLPAEPATAQDEVIAIGRADCDLTSPAEVARLVTEAAPHTIINAAAWTAVDAAEDPVNHAQVEAINAATPRLLTEALRSGSRPVALLHVSTDYVFAGDRDPAAGQPYSEYDLPAPRTFYGRSKLAGERATLMWPNGYVVRTAWLYGDTGRNFVRTMLDLEKSQDTVNVVDDQWGQPTWARDLAQQVILLGRRAAKPTGRPGGILHATNAGAATWHAFAREIFRLVGADPQRVRPVSSGEFPRAAARPGWSVLGHAEWARFGMPAMRPWREAVAEALATGFGNGPDSVDGGGLRGAARL